jgi:DNA-binding response OmpR family regulator
MLTARDAVRDRVRGLDAGADDYLKKPFTFEELLERLKAVTRRVGARPLLSYGPVEFDRRNRVVRINGNVVAMTATELRLLEYFMLRAEAVVTREELALHVWGDVPGRESNVIEVYISYLRKKLQPAGFPLVRTVRGVGYTFRKG